MGRQTREGDREGSLQKDSRKRSPTERWQRDRKSLGPAGRPASDKKRNHKEKPANKELNHKDQDSKRCEGNE